MLTCVHICLWTFGHQLETRATREQMTSHTCWRVPLYLRCIHICVQANVVHPLTWIGLGVRQCGVHAMRLQCISMHSPPTTPSTYASATWRPCRASLHILHAPCSCIRRSCIWGCLGGSCLWPIVVCWLGSCCHGWRGEGGGALSLSGFGGMGVIVLKSMSTWHARMNRWHDTSAMSWWCCWHR